MYMRATLPSVRALLTRVVAEVSYAEFDRSSSPWMTCATTTAQVPALRIAQHLTATHRYNFCGFGNYASTVTSGSGSDGTASGTAISNRTALEAILTTPINHLATYA